jgi:hypothetical protein
MRSKVQEIRTDVYKAICAVRAGEDIADRLPSLRGSLGYLRNTSPGVVRRLERQLEEAGVRLSARGCHSYSGGS